MTTADLIKRLEALHPATVVLLETAPTEVTDIGEVEAIDLEPEDMAAPAEENRTVVLRATARTRAEPPAGLDLSRPGAMDPSVRPVRLF